MRLRRFIWVLGLALALVACGKEKDKKLEFQPEPLRLQRLLTRQYKNAVRDLVNQSAADTIELPEDVAAEGFTTIGASTISLSDSAVRQYELAARIIGEAAASDPTFHTRWVPCTPASATDSACFTQFVEKFGRVAWRRPLTTEEVDRYVAVAVTAAGDFGDFDKGIEYAVMGFIQSPYFMYQVQIGDPHPKNANLRVLNDYELATRLSFFLLDTTPSEDLLTRVENGELSDRDSLRLVVEQLLDTDGAKGAVNSFYEERFHLSKLDAVFKDSETFPDFTQGTGLAMKEEAFRMLDYVVFEEDLDMRELLTADYTFVNDELAEIYGVTPPTTGGWIKRNWPAQQERSGLFSQSGFLTVEAHAKLTSPTRRGRAIQERLLCTPIPPPPPDVVAELPEQQPGQTMRDILEAHQENESCAGCHVLMDNIGFGLENYDAIGRFRTYDNGLPIDPSGEVSGVGSFSYATGLADLLYDEPKVTDCWVRNTFRQALAHTETSGEEPIVEYWHGRFEDSGYRVRELLIDVVTSDPFRVVGEQE